MGAVALTIAFWAAHFAVTYGFTAFACARQISAVVPWVVGSASAAALLALAAIAVRAGIRVSRTALLADHLALGLSGLAMLAVLWEASSLIWVPACG
jgi:hypothetical protein